MAKNLYECLVISPPDQNEAARAPLREKIEAALKKFDSSIVHWDDWGTRKLTFRINKTWRGHYTLFFFEGPAAAVTELDRTLKIAEDAWRHLIIRPEERPDFADLERRAIARAEAEKNRPPREFGDDDEGGDFDRGDRGRDRGDREFRGRGDRGDRDDRPPRGDRDDRPPRGDRDDRPPRGDAPPAASEPSEA